MSGSPQERAERAAKRVRERSSQILELAVTLVREQSTLGREAGAQAVVADFLRGAGLSVSEIVPDAAEALASAQAGYPFIDYDDRSCVVGRASGSGTGRSLHLSGHVDVVPVDADGEWTWPPWGGVVENGRLWGRGSGDMKGGLAAYLVATAVALEVVEDPVGDLFFSSVIEEECGGNGMWAVTRMLEADATLIGESTNGSLGYAGTGVIWVRLTAEGTAGHAGDNRRAGAFDEIAAAVMALRGLEAELNASASDSVFGAVSDWPYGLTVGQIGGGVWPSSAPARLEARIRVGFGPDRSVVSIQDAITRVLAAATPRVTATFEGFRANAYQHDPVGPLGRAVTVAHRDVLGIDPKPLVFTATTDARFVAGDCLCYGPSAGGLHGADEWVDVESLERTAEVVARLATSWIAGGSPEPR